MKFGNIINKFSLKEETKKDLLIALYSLPGILIIYIVGFMCNNIIYASIAASGAVTAGYGANKKILRYPFAPMIIAVIGMSLCAGLGSISGNYYIIYVIGSMFFACLCSLVGLIDQNAWWILLQWAIAYFVAGYYAGNLYSAVHRCCLIMVGGLFQCACIIFLLRKFSFHRNIIQPKNMAKILKNIYEDIDKKIRFHAAAVYAALTIFICFIFIYFFKIQYYYWATMTALVILKPDFMDTFKRAKNRLLGTFIGIVIATGLVLLNSSKYVMTAEIIVSLYLCYVFSNQTYAILTTFITISAVLMFSFTGKPELEIAFDRIIATAIGGFSAIIIMAIRSFYFKLSKIHRL